MLWYNDKISLRQLQMLIIINIFGTGVIFLPRITAQIAGPDGWVVVIITTLFATICTYIITSLSAIYPSKTFYEYTSIITNKPIAFILSVFLVLRLVIHAALTLRISLEIISSIMLPTTPQWILALLIIAISGYGASKGYETRARLAEILIFIILIPILFVFSLAAFNVDYTNILPILNTDITTLLKGGFFTLNAFTSIEFLLLVYPYVNKFNGVRKSATVSVLIVGIIMTIITLITISRFGIYNINLIAWPVIQMMDSTNLPGSFIQRQGALVMSFFIISVFAIINACLFFSSLTLKSVVKRGDHSYYIAITMVVTFIVCLIPKTIAQVHMYANTTFFTLGISYMVFVPIILLILAKFKGNDEDTDTGVYDHKRVLKFLPVIIIISCTIFLASCDKQEMEEREYVTALGIDKTYEDGKPNYLLTIQPSNLKDEEDDEVSIITSISSTIPGALSSINLRGNKNMYLGILQTIILGEEILKDGDFFEHTIQSLTKNYELSNDVYLLSVNEKASDIIKELPQDNYMPTSSKFHKKDNSVINQLAQKTLEDITTSIRTSNTALIPIVSLNDGHLQVYGINVIKDNVLVGALPKDNIQGYLFALGSGKGVTLHYPHNLNNTLLNVTNVKKATTFTQENNTPHANIDISVKGDIEAIGLKDLNEDTIKVLSSMYAKDISKQVKEAYEKLATYDIDALQLLEDMRKLNNELYKKYDGKLNITLNVNVDIESTDV